MIRRGKQLHQAKIQRAALHLLRIKQYSPIIVTIRRRHRLKCRIELLELSRLTVHRKILRTVNPAILHANQLHGHRPIVVALDPERRAVGCLYHRDACIAGVRKAHPASGVGGHRHLQRGVDGMADGVLGVECDVDVTYGLVGG